MSKYSKEKMKEHREVVRSVIVSNPYASYRQIAEATGLDKDYIALHVRKICKERATRLQRSILLEDLAVIEDTYLKLIAESFDILGGNISPREKLEAARTIATLYKLLLEMKLNAGAYKKDNQQVLTYEQVLGLLHKDMSEGVSN